jgi:CheY-like chemotaxis protein
MRKFTKTDRDTSKFVLVYIKEILEQAIDFLRPRWMNIAQAMGVKYHIDKGGIKELPAIQGNPSELREVFINIINNALDSMHDGGRISFRTWTDNNTVLASISDTGVGMTEDVRKRLFDPFFTTKRAEGSGLGMSLVYGIVTEHGGKIDVKSEEGKGTTLILSIPIMRGTTQQAVSPKLSQEIKVKKLRILVVDDEQDICMILDKFFSEDGHIVKTVNRGAEAIKLLKTEVFDLILSDLIMPEVSGYDVTKAVKALEKKPKVGLITGWGDTIKAKDKESLKVDFIVKKPFDFSELSRSINNALST